MESRRTIYERQESRRAVRSIGRKENRKDKDNFQVDKNFKLKRKKESLKRRGIDFKSQEKN